MHVIGRSHGYMLAQVDKFPVHPHTGTNRARRRPHRSDEGTSEWFWNDHVRTRTAPPIDPYTADASEIATHFPAEVVQEDQKVEADFPDMAVDDYERLTTLKADASYIKEQIAEIEDRVKAQIGDREYLTANGKPLFRWQYDPAGRRSTRNRCCRSSPQTEASSRRRLLYK